MREKFFLKISKKQLIFLILGTHKLIKKKICIKFFINNYSNAKYIQVNINKDTIKKKLIKF